MVSLVCLFLANICVNLTYSKNAMVIPKVYTNKLPCNLCSPQINWDDEMFVAGIQSGSPTKHSPKRMKSLPRKNK